MKKLLFLLLLSLSVYSVSAQQFKLAVQVKNEWEETNDGYVLEFTASNDDYCDYYFYMELGNVVAFRGARSPYFTSVRPGSGSIMKLTPISQNALTSANYRFWVFRGNINSELNADFRYALPIKIGDSVRAFEKENSNYTLIFDLGNTTTDTIYASRRGVVCNDILSDYSAKGHDGFKGQAQQITVYHKDGSFGEYKGFTTPLVSPGSNVEMGTPIALVRKEGENPKIVEFAVYFLDKNKVENKEIGDKHSHLRPFFHTPQGDIRLENNISYVSERTDEMMIQDMSKREAKKYQKSKK